MGSGRTGLLVALGVAWAAVSNDCWATPPAMSAPEATPSASYSSSSLSSLSRHLRSGDAASGLEAAPASKAFAGAMTDPRIVLRRYYLEYDPSSHESLLTSVQMEGRCPNPEHENAAEDVPATSCARLPRLSFDYQRVAGTGQPLKDSQGNSFEGFAERVSDLAGSPPRSLDDPLTGMMDVNGDGLPDVVTTAPALFGGGMGVYFNGLDSTGKIGFAAVKSVPIVPVGQVDAGVLLLNNPVVSALDVDGEGVVNLVHMPKAKDYSVFAPTYDAVAKTWKWLGRAVETHSAQSVKIDFTTQARNVQVMDVNGDGLVDVVYSTPTEYQTFLSLGRYPNGADQFGQATLTSATDAEISNDPIRTCAPWSATPVRFSDADVRVADMNGDGLPDIVRLRSGQVLYWPGRGNGFWGTGDRDDCGAGSFAVNRHVEMYAPPAFGVTDPGSLMLSDINGDGLADLVEVRANDVDIYLNDNGAGWTDRHTLAKTPARPNGSSYVRITDVDGSGSPDLLWGEGHQYRYIDLTGGVVPHLLTSVQNGLGMTTELDFESSAKLMRDAAKLGKPWTEPLAPTVTPVLVRSTVRDHLELVGRPAGIYVTEYSYRDPVFEGRQREFRGFRQAAVRSVGDGNSPTSTQRTQFLLGECPKEFSGTAADVCNPSTLWQDNWAEALKGLPVTVETFDDQGTYLATQHTEYELRQLYQGLDGRRVVVPYPIAKGSLLYDTSHFDRSETSLPVEDVVYHLAGVQATRPSAVVKRAQAGTVRVRSESTYDDFGNMLESDEQGCIEGCPNGPDETLSAHAEYALAPNDASGWIWREIHGFTTGSAHPAPRNEHFTDYDSRGKVLAVRAVLGGSLPLKRFHAGGGQVAPAPAQASGGVDAPVQILLGTNVYDELGHVTSQRGPDGACSSGEVDPLYGQLPTVSRSRTGPVGADGCGQTELVHRVTYDRGMEVVTDSLDANGQPSHFEYDGFGRVIESTFADPNQNGQLAGAPTLIVNYDLPDDPSTRPYAVTTVDTADGSSPNVFSYRESILFTDSRGRSIASLTQADPGAGDGGDYVVGRFALYDTKGAKARVFEPSFYSGAPEGVLTAVALTQSRSTARQYDAFGRPINSINLDGTLESHYAYGALSEDACDAADMAAGPRQGTCLTTASDGHGRAIRRTERIHVGGAIDERSTLNEYLPTGELVRVIQRHAGNDDVVRWLRYDTLGRRVLNVEPNTSGAFNPDPNADPDTVRAWRYAYDDAGDVVGMSDARGCGANYFYDSGRRMIAEDRSPCLSTQDAYTPPDLATGNGTEAFYRYDSPDPDTASIRSDSGERLNIAATVLLGRLASVSSLGSKGVFQYDFLGRQTGAAVRLAAPDAPPGVLSTRYAPRWYVQTHVLDALDRTLNASTGATVPELLGPDGTSNISTVFSKRGMVSAVGGSYGPLVNSARYDADGRALSVRLADAALTERDFEYDQRRRLDTVLTYRAAAPLWTDPGGSPSSGPTEQLSLEHYVYHYDEVNNVTGIDDLRIDSEWPASAKPVSRTFAYDDLYRLVQSKSTGPADSWRSPFAAENADPERRPQPSPHVAFDTRSVETDFSYDWLGNFEKTTDDQAGFWDRSLGAVTVGSAGRGPNQIQAATNRLIGPGSGRNGDLGVAYDDAGNTTRLVVRRDGGCLPSAASCWQRFEYEWNEVGQLVRARRWDLSPEEGAIWGSVSVTTSPARAADADLRYFYDASGSRVRKTATAPDGASAHTLYVFPTLEIRTTTWNTAVPAPDYIVDAQTEQVRLAAGAVVARVFRDSEGTLPGAPLHVFLTFADQVGSTSFVVDRATGELVEFSTYAAYGGSDSDYRPERWGSFREPYRFSGKEEDVQVGLTYFGARYYSPFLGVWMSADPASIHELRSEINPYAYVHGRPISTVDPDGRFVALLIGAAVGLVVGYVSSVAVQSVQNGFANVDWGIHGALGAGIVGAVSGALTLGVSSLLAGAIAPTGSSALLSATGMLVGATVGGGVGGAGAYVTQCALSGQRIGAGDLFEAAGVGSLFGASFGALGAASTGLQALDRATAPSVAEAVAGASGRSVLASVAEGALVATAQAATAYGFLKLLGASNEVALVGASAAGANGAIMGGRGGYNWKSPSGYVAALQDATTGLVGTALGDVSYGTNSLLPNTSYDAGYSFRQNRSVFAGKGGLGFGKFAFTQGNVTSNWEEGTSPSEIAIQENLLNDHENLHMWQSRTFGPVYQATYLVWMAGGSLAGTTYAGVSGASWANSVKAAGYASNPFEGMAYHNQRYFPSDKFPGAEGLLIWP